MRWPSAVLVCAAVSVARAETPSPQPGDRPELRARIRAQLDGELRAVGRADAAVDDKRTARTAARRRRARAAYKVLRSGAPLWAEPDLRMTIARTRAAARHLLARDRAELALLDEESAQLDLAVGQLGGLRALAERVRLPAASLAWPVSPAAIAGVAGAGTFVHAPSRAVLSRRGLEIEVAEGADALAMADGVIRYAGPLRGLAEAVVIDHGDVVSVTSRLRNIGGKVGDAVRRGEVIGRAERRHIYVELRLPLGPGGLPLDPQTLLVARP